MENRQGLLEHIAKLHTTKLGIERIKRNLGIDEEDVVAWCKQKIAQKNANISRTGKNWYVQVEDIVFTINAYSYTLITAHRKKGYVHEDYHTKSTNGRC